MRYALPYRANSSLACCPLEGPPGVSSYAHRAKIAPAVVASCKSVIVAPHAFMTKSACNRFSPCEAPDKRTLLRCQHACTVGSTTNL